MYRTRSQSRSRYSSSRSQKYTDNTKGKKMLSIRCEDDVEEEIDSGEYSEVFVKDNNIYFYTAVEPNTALELIMAIRDLTKKNQILSISYNIPPPTINIYINSEGGEVHSALSVFDTIRQNIVPINTIISGNASSAATIISLAGHTREITSNSYMLIHNISSGFWGKMHEFEDELKNMAKLTSNLKKIYKENT